MKSSQSFSHQIALVTGAGSGIGHALTLKLIESGVIVYACDRDISSLEGLQSERLFPCLLDVTSVKDWSEVFSRIVDEHGGLDLLFNNAGVTLLAEASSLSPSHWRELMAVNVQGVVNGLSLVYPHMVERGKGHILNTSSLAAVTGYATAAPYTCSKAYLLGLHKSLEPEAREKGVVLSLVCPGYVKTKIFLDERILHDDPDLVRSSAPLGAITPEKAAEQIVKGVLAQKRYILFPFTTKLLWWLAHWIPAAMIPFQKKLLAPFREQKN